MRNRIIKNLSKIYHLLKIIIRVRWFKTIKMNFALLPFKQAVKFPIVVTGKLIITSLKGSFHIEAPLKFGMINFGKDMDNMPISYCPGRVLIAGKVVFRGNCIISQSVNLCVCQGAKIDIGHCVVVLSGVQLKSFYSIKIGDYTRLTSGCFVMDTNVHCIRDVETGHIARNFAPIVIGSRCWLTMNTSVTAGTILPDYCITARGSLLNKDYRNICGPGTMLGGAPAKILKTGVRRLFDSDTEIEITKYFLTNPSELFYQDMIGFDEPQEVNVVRQFTVY